MAAAWNVRVSGRVQGVGFRFSAHRRASQLGLTGWVRNEPDGSVQVFVQGDPERTATFIHWLSQGPPGAFVSDTVRTSAAPDPRYQRFEILF